MFPVSFCSVFLQLNILIGILAALCDTTSNETVPHSCYVCSTTFKKEWHRSDPCLRGLKTLSVQQCTIEQKLCEIKTSSIFEKITKITRQCTEKCQSGCKRYLFGVLKVDCNRCCDTQNCNYGNNTTKIKISLNQVLYAAVAAVIITRKYCH